jgi:hypothetical protein
MELSQFCVEGQKIEEIGVSHSNWRDRVFASEDPW